MLVVAVVIALGSLGVILFTGDETASTSSSSSAATSGEGAGGATMVSIKDFAFDPDPIEVDAGTKIEWVNDDSVNHTATSDDGSAFDTGNLGSGQTSKAVTLDKPGTYTYVCEVHPYMHGTVEVK